MDTRLEVLKSVVHEPYKSIYYVRLYVPDDVRALVSEFVPHGRGNANLRGQTSDKYTEDFRRGLLGEIATHVLFYPGRQWDIERAQNIHAPDVGDIAVKTISTYRGVRSVVYQDTDRNNILVNQDRTAKILRPTVWVDGAIDRWYTFCPPYNLVLLEIGAGTTFPWAPALSLRLRNKRCVYLDNNYYPEVRP